jgi:hypothetical protein
MSISHWGIFPGYFNWHPGMRATIRYLTWQPMPWDEFVR